MDVCTQDSLAEGSGAVFSSDGRYRYALWRNWSAGRGRVLFVGLNPSTADARRDDPTIRRLIGFARSWDFAGMQVANLFAWRSTRLEGLKSAADPVGSDNRGWLRRLHEAAQLTVVCWGNHGSYREQDRAALALLADVHCLAINVTGAPAHPLYLPKGLQPFPYEFASR